MLLLSFASASQLVDLSRVPPYRPVFVATDAFDSSYLTQLEKATTQNLPDTVQLAIGNDLAYYWHTRNLDRACALAYKTLVFAKSIHNKIWEGRLLVTLGAVLLRQEKLDSAFKALTSAIPIVTKKDLPQLYTQLGYVMERKGQLSKAADYALEALHTGDTLHDIKAQAMAYSDLSNLFWKQSKFDKGIEYGLHSVALFKQRGIKDMDYSFTLYVLGNNYLSVKDYPDALQYFRLALAQSEQYQFYNNLADIYIALNQLYTLTADYAKATFNARQAIRYSTLLDNNFMLMRSWLCLAHLQNLTHQPDTAIASLKICLRVAGNYFGDKFFLSRAYKELGDAYAATGDYKNAYTAFQQYDILKDSVFTAEADQRVAQLQTEFEVAQKESTIKTQQQSILQQRRLQWLTLGAAGLLVLILAGLYRTYHNKQRVNAQLEMLNESLEQKNNQLDKRNAENELLLKEIHHRVKNNLEIVSGLLALQAAQTDHPSAQAVMQASQNRVLSMGIIHQKLYQKGNLAGIEMKDYFLNLGESILDAYNAADRIRITCNMLPMDLDIDTAVPVGLIANELLTNSLKYAFGANQPGEITIDLKKTEVLDQYIFCLGDNGIGRPENTIAKGTGFGTELVNLLVQQLNGKLTTCINHGTLITIRFKYTKPHNEHTR
ncbi:histidine kinase dimerization/phosphoacceptor domain -containing protein [Ferruginibacter paludis]|uniref:tetratricopeptide repeat-containing sensor histidine kinase n=1 Tax=Ferruginibacter paludis TaxID=1310417 RepID=UPI0025B51DDC|nr:histidine kinase dimerization/phosphoacceptor domain -containing protein [Ferruginibacter paludis]MDN3657041.1 histidine kinase dimerization/phosphoacceptor domain -containing protein [Ferruginibacter paludis]